MNIPLKNFFVGIFVLTAIGLLVCTVLFLKPGVGDGKQRLIVRFSDINKINVGTRVMFAGRPIGEVISIEEIHDARGQPTDELGRVYFYQLTLKIDSGIKVFNTDEISIQTSGLLGERSIAIVPKSPPKGVTPRLITNQPVYANSVDPLENAVVEFSELSASMEQTFNEVSKWLKQHGDEVANSIKLVGSASNQVEEAIQSVNDQSVISSLSDILTRIQSAMSQLEQHETFVNAGTAVHNISKASQNFDLIAQDLAQGKGTLGKLIADPDFYLSANAILSKVNTLMNDVNNYGVLFNLNKRWQRLRIQRADFKNALDTPQTFRSFFESEVDEINTAMGRLSMLIDRASDSTESDLLLQNERFQRDFAELLRQADQLSSNLRLYNQQLLDAKGGN